MSIIFCSKHGRQPGEKVSKYLLEEFKKGSDISTKTKDSSFVFEDYECPFYGLQEESEQLPETCEGGDFFVQNDERLGEVLERITVMCLSCLKEAMRGNSLPVRDGET